MVESGARFGGGLGRFLGWGSGVWGLAVSIGISSEDFARSQSSKWALFSK